MNALNTEIAAALMRTAPTGMVLKDLTTRLGSLPEYTLPASELTPEEIVFIQLHEQHHADVVAAANRRQAMYIAVKEINDQMLRDILGTKPSTETLTPEEVFGRLRGKDTPTP